MKKRLQKSLSFSATLFAVLLILASCQQDKMDFEPEAGPPEFSLHKDIVVTSEDGANSLTLRISANEQNLLDAYSADNFVATPVPDGEPVEEFLAAQFPADHKADLEEEALSNELETEKPIQSIEIIGRTKAEGVAMVALTILPLEAEAARLFGLLGPRLFYSPTGTVTAAYIQRKSNSSATVRFGLKARATNNDPYSTIVSDYLSLTAPSYSFGYNFSPAVNRCYFRVKWTLLTPYTTAFAY